MLTLIRSIFARAAKYLGLRGKNADSQPLFELIAGQIMRDPNCQIDESQFPKIKLGVDTELSFAAGAMDAVWGGHSGQDKGREAVERILAEIDKGTIVEWKQIDAKLHGMRAIGCVDSVLEDIRRSGISFKAVRLFWTMAKCSPDYEAVKWGLAIGTLSGIGEEKLHDLLIFARHPEFTLYSVYALRRFATAKPEWKHCLVDLLPFSRQWGVIKLIEQIVFEPDLINDIEVQRKVLVFGMENNGGIPMEVAFTIAKHIDLSKFLGLAESDNGVYAAIFLIMDTLINEPNPLGGIDELPDGKALLKQYVGMLTKRNPDVRTLCALHDIGEFLKKQQTINNEPAELLVQVRQLWGKYLGDSVLREGLRDSDTRWRTLNLIEKLKIVSLLPEVREVFQENPDYASISVLAEIGNAEDLELLLASVERFVDLRERATKKFSPINVPVAETKGIFEYGRIVQTLGRLATPEAIEHLKLAASDYDPAVRSSACMGFALMPIDKVDGEILALVKQRLNDPMAYVRESAKEASAHLARQ
ncbi:MAG: HEAT repeat domain-containing protein [Acidobacteriia bacterium]|nr:HEAT repeat domain-containing protein [Terriglobia bacterium]